MQNLKYKHVFIKCIQLLVSFFLLLNLIFTRSFVGLKIFGYRLGEYIILIGFILLTFLSIKLLRQKKSNEFLLFVFIYFYFFVQVLFTGAEFSNTYIYKAASFIGVISFYYLGLKIPQKYLNSKNLSKYLLLTIPIIYMFGSSRYPKFISDFFLINSDKFELIKASDILMAIVIIVFFCSKSNSKNLIYFSIFFTIPLFLPILLYLSRGSFLALSLLFIIVIFIN